MKSRLRFSVVIAAVLAASMWLFQPVFAAPSACGQHYAQGAAPDILNSQLSSGTRELCYGGFGVMHSKLSRTALWSAEHLTRARLDQARGLIRASKFHVEDRLPADERAELRDYAKSGYDRGHLAPSADMPDMRQQQESFSLANMVPQNPENNRVLWEGIESATRSMAKQRGELYVISGPMFQGSSLKQLNGRVLVPTHLFKVIYDPRTSEAGAYVVQNVATSNYETMSVAALERMAGINLFPAMPDSVKQRPMQLPAPVSYDKRRSMSDTSHRAVDAVKHNVKSYLSRKFSP